MKWPSRDLVWIFVSVLVVLGVIGWLYKEAFSVEDDLKARLELRKKEAGYIIDNTVSDREECAKRTSCSECLTVTRDSVYRGDCGWCPGAGTDGKGRCVPKVTSTTNKTSSSGFFPVVPLDANGDPEFQCPLSTFKASLDVCEGINCGDFKNCADCAQNKNCGWCKSTGKCEARKVFAGKESGVDTAGSTLCPAVESDPNNYVTNSSEANQCPRKACADITDCLECAATPNCGYCVETKKCLKIRDTQNITTTNTGQKPNATKGGELTLTVTNAFAEYKADQRIKITDTRDSSNTFTGKVKSYSANKTTGIASLAIKEISDIRGTFPPTDNRDYSVVLVLQEIITKCGDQNNSVTSPSQCPGALPKQTLTPGKTELSTYRPSKGQLSNIQTNLFDDSELGDIQTNDAKNIIDISKGGGAVVPPLAPKTTTITSSPGVVQPINAGSRGISYPSSAGLSGSGGPLEEYIEMLIRSQLAQQGVRTNEPFQVAPVTQNAQKYFRKEAKVLFGKPTLLSREDV